MEPLRRVSAGVYETRDEHYIVERKSRHVWQLRTLGRIVAECDTKLACECVLARDRAMIAGIITTAEFYTECERWLR